jgi:hypothetical protein
MMKDKSNPAVPREIKKIQPIKAKAVNTHSTSTGRSAPMASTAARAPPKASTSILSRRSAPSRLPIDERKPDVEAIAAQRKSSVISTKQTTRSKDAYRMTETCMRAPVTLQQAGNFSSLNCSKNAIRESIQLGRAVEDEGRTIRHPEAIRKCSAERSDIREKPAIKQEQSLLFSGEMGERWLAYDAVVNKINNKNIESHSPEGSVVPSSLPTPSSVSMPQASVPRIASNKPMLMPTVTQPGSITVIGKNGETSADKHVPEASATLTSLPIPSPILPMQAATLRQPLGEVPPPTEVVPRQPNRCVTAAEPISSDLHSSKIETVRKQSEPVKTPSKESEGRYLERAAAYV